MISVIGVGVKIQHRELLPDYLGNVCFPDCIFGWGACGVCSSHLTKDHKSHLNLYDFSTLRPSFEAGFLFLKFCFNGER